jgi:hypothetical protein
MGSIRNATAVTMLNTAVDACDNGTGNPAAHLKIYSGSVPTNAESPLGGATLLADLVMSNPAFGSASDANPGATVAAATITADSAANATGTASFFRIEDRDGTVQMQGTVSATGGGGELQLNTVSLVLNGAVSVTALNVTLPE